MTGETYDLPHTKHSGASGETRESANSQTQLTGHQRRFLRALAHGLKPIVQVGKEGVTDRVIGATESALTEHELIKVKLHEPENKRAMATQLAAGTGAELCGLVGHIAILFRADAENPRIELPQRLRR